ncbi:homocysteine S-methyltransferase family protein [Bacillus sp. SL00103]
MTWKKRRPFSKLHAKKRRSHCHANVSMHEQGVLQDGTPLEDGLSELSSLGAMSLALTAGWSLSYDSGTRCTDFRKFSFISLSNSSLPSLEEGRLVYDTDNDYFRKSALEFRNQGARIIGGCLRNNASAYSRNG